LLFSPDKTPQLRRCKFTALVLTAVLAVVIALLTLTPVNLPGGLAGPDKLYHFIAFAALILPGAALYPRGFLWLVPAALLFGGAIEIIQPWVGRGRELVDFWADTWGVGAGLLVGTATGYFMTSKARRRTA